MFRRRKIEGLGFQLTPNDPLLVLNQQKPSSSTQGIYKLKDNNFELNSKQYNMLKQQNIQLQHQYSIQTHQIESMRLEIDQIQKNTIDIFKYEQLQKELFQHQIYLKNLQEKIQELQSENSHLISSSADSILKNQLRQTIQDMHSVQYKYDQLQTNSEQQQLILRDKLCDLEKTYCETKFDLENQVFKLKDGQMKIFKECETQVKDSRIQIKDIEEQYLQMKEKTIQQQIQLNQIPVLQDQIDQERKRQLTKENEFYLLEKEYQEQLQQLQLLIPAKKVSRFSFLAPQIIQISEDFNDLKYSLLNAKKCLQIKINMNTYLHQITTVSYYVYTKHRSSSPEVYKPQLAQKDQQSKQAQIDVLKNLNAELQHDYQQVLKEKITLDLEVQKLRKLQSRVEQENIYEKIEDLQRDNEMQKSVISDLQHSRLIDQEIIDKIKRKSK
ncbi:hypothetical protein SS50377_27978 [Spironucleus salmonicida]|nr:hypothetical protein SS50377_27978 [Spironucleus salmonicida]